MTVVEEHLPTEMPASVASYRASSLPCAKAAGEAVNSQAPAQRPASIRSADRDIPGEIMWSVFTRGGPALRALDISFKQIWPANNGPARLLGKSASTRAGTLYVCGEYAFYMMAKAPRMLAKSAFCEV